MRRSELRSAGGLRAHVAQVTTKDRAGQNAKSRWVAPLTIVRSASDCTCRNVKRTKRSGFRPAGGLRVHLTKVGTIKQFIGALIGF